MKLLKIVSIIILFSCYNLLLSQNTDYFKNIYTLTIQNELEVYSIDSLEVLIKYASTSTNTDKKEIETEINNKCYIIKHLTNILGKDIYYLNGFKSGNKFNSVIRLLNENKYIEYCSPVYKDSRNDSVAITNVFYIKIHSDDENLLLNELSKIYKFDIIQYPIKNVFKCININIKNINTFELSIMLQQKYNFEFVEPSFIHFGKITTNDPLYGDQWSLNNTGQANGTPGADIDVENAWNITSGNFSIKIAVFDCWGSQEQFLHEDISIPVTNRHDFTGEGFNANGFLGEAHGINCAGVIAALKDNNLGLSGIAPNCDLHAYKVCTMTSDYGFASDDGNIADAIVYAGSYADVISNSLTYPSSSIVDDAIENFITNGRNNKGGLFVSSSGNDNLSSITYPSSNSNVIAVGASSPCDQRKSPSSCDLETDWGSNYGSGLDVVGPGVKIISTDIVGTAGFNSGDYNPLFHGTSSACPLVSATIGLILSSNSTLTYSETRYILESTCDKVGGTYQPNQPGQPNGSWNNEMGYGRINAFKSVLKASKPDLIINNPFVSPTAVLAGNEVTASFIEDNIGYIMAVPNYVKFYLSSDDVLTINANGDIYLGQYFTNQSLPPLSQTNLLNKILTIPPSVSTGLYYLFFWADGSEIVSESVEDNNFATTMLNVTGVTQLADIIIQNPSVLPTSILPGGTGTVYCKNKNQGVVPAGPSYTSVWLSQDQVYNGAPTDINLNADIAIPALDPGQTSNLLSEQITIPPGTGCGPWYIMFGADALNQVDEGVNETNNQDFIPLNISCPLLCDNDFACGPPSPPTLAISSSCNNTTCSTIGATPPSPDVPYVSCAGIPYQSSRYDDDVWFKIIPANSNQITITVTPISNLTNFDPVVGLYIYNGSCPSLVQVGCADGNGNGLSEELVYTPAAGTTYLIRVFSYGMDPVNSGDFQICVQETQPQTGLFWVGNSGNWSNGSHWSNSSGGASCNCIPTQDDNVFFDANSFSGAGQSVIVDQTAYCKSMEWTGAISSSTFTGGYPINIYGSLILNSSMNVTYTGQITFKSNNPGNNIQTFGKTLSSPIYLDALGGEWTLQDNFNVPNSVIYLVTGSLNTNSKTVNAYRFESITSNIRFLTLGASTINLSSSGTDYYSWAWFVYNTNLSLSSGTSTINLTGTNGYFYSPYTGTYYDVNFTGVNSQNLNCGTNSVFHNVSFNGYCSLNGTATYNNVTFLKDASLNSTSTFNNLTLAAGKSYTFAASNSFTINGILSADGTCATPTQIFSNTQSTASSINKSSGTVTINYVQLKNMTASGGALFTANNCTDFGNNNGWTINTPLSQNFYWIGNGGNWTDANHWSLTSGGASSGCIPTPYNNVFFDANSFSGAGQSVIVDQTAYCKSMEWTGAISSSTFTGGYPINIYGSLILNSSMNVTYTGQITFKSNNPGNNIQTFGKTLSSPIYFDALGGEWTLQDNLNVPNSVIYLVTGSLNTNSKTINAYRFESITSNIRFLTLGASSINLSSSGTDYYSWAWSVYNTNLSLSSGTSTINLTGTNGYFYSPYTDTYYDVNFTGVNSQNLNCGTNSVFHNVSFNGYCSLNGTATYNNVTFFKDASLNSTSTFNNLTLAAGKSYTFASSNSFTINGTLSADGTCATPTQIFSNAQNTASSISKYSGVVTVNYVQLKNITANGGALFTANNSTDLGNNNGWIFTPFGSQNYYWIGNGGNWSDGNHWSFSSGGPSSGCIPTLYDNVFFNSNSFNNGGQSVNIDQLAYCKSMEWTGAISSSTLTGGYPINIYGSLILNSSMNVTYTGQITFKSNNPGNNIQTFGKTLSSPIYFDALGGEWTLQDNFNVPNSVIYLVTGSLNTNSKTINAYRFESITSNIRFLTLGASTINLSSSGTDYYSWAWFVYNTNLSLSSGTSTINLTGTNGYFYSPYTDIYYDVNFTGVNSQNLNCGTNSVFHNVSFNGYCSLNGTATYNNITFLKDASLNSTSTFNNLTLAAGKSYTFAASNSFTINGTLSADGTCATPTQIFSNTQSTASSINKSSGTVTINYVQLKNMTASGGALFTANNCTDFGNNNGWTINTPLSQNFYWIGNGGNWTDANHWSLTSGGASSGCIPTPYNNVFFDANSFSGGGQSVIVDQTAYCKSMEWTGAISSSTFTGGYPINIYGSLILNSSMNVTYTGQITFKSNNPGNNIQTFGKTLSSPIYFDALGGEWTLQDNFNVPNSVIYLVTGSLNTNSKTINAYRFESITSNIRFLTLGASTINLSSSGTDYYSWAWFVYNTNLSLSSGTSTINLTGTNGYFYSPYTDTYYDVNFTGVNSQNLNCGTNSVFHNVSFNGYCSLNGTATYNNVTFFKDASLNSTSTFNNLTLAIGKTYTFGNSSIFTFLGNLVANGSPENYITITNPNNYTTFSKTTGSVCLDYITMQNIHTDGGAFFFAGANSNNISGNQGWSFTSCDNSAPATPTNPTSNSPQCNVVTLTASGSPPSGVVWYWQGIACGTNTNLGSGPTFQATASGTYYIRAYNYGCSCWSSGCGSTAVIVNQTTDRTWTGLVSSDWTNGNNWTCGTAPYPNSDVTIPSGTPYSPHIPSGMYVWCRSLNVMPGAVITVEVNAHLSVINY